MIWFARNRPISYLFSIKLAIFWILWKLDCFRIFHFCTFLKVFVICHFFIWEESEVCITHCINLANIFLTSAEVTASGTLCYLPHILYSCILNTRHLKAYAKECIIKIHFFLHLFFDNSGSSPETMGLMSLKCDFQHWYVLVHHVAHLIQYQTNQSASVTLQLSATLVRFHLHGQKVIQ